MQIHERLFYDQRNPLKSVKASPAKKASSPSDAPRHCISHGVGLIRSNLAGPKLWVVAGTRSLGILKLMGRKLRVMSSDVICCIQNRSANFCAAFYKRLRHNAGELVG